MIKERFVRFDFFFTKRSKTVKNTLDVTDEAVTVIDDAEDEGNEGCQVRRKIEDYLERKRYKDELGDLGLEM